MSDQLLFYVDKRHHRHISVSDHLRHHRRRIDSIVYPVFAQRYQRSGTYEIQSQPINKKTNIENYPSDVIRTSFVIYPSDVYFSAKADVINIHEVNIREP